MRLFDTHCHLQDPAFDDVDAAIERARAAGVAGMLLCGYDVESSKEASRIASGHEGVLAAVGVHPHDASELNWPAAIEWFAEASAEPSVAAVGEIGLDFYRELSPRTDQEGALEIQLHFANAWGKPISVHSRGAEDAIYVPMKRFAEKSPLHAQRRPVGVMHCFGGTVAQAWPFIGLGFLVSVPCTVTYPNNETGRTMARDLPLESLVIETDSPYLPPQGRRGKRNEPAFIAAAVEAIATLRGITPDEVALATTANAERVFGVTAHEGMTSI